MHVMHVNVFESKEMACILEELVSSNRITAFSDLLIDKLMVRVLHRNFFPFLTAILKKKLTLRFSLSLPPPFSDI